MQLKLTPPANIQVEIQLPSSKSISNRALILSYLAGANRWPENLSECDDTRVLMQALTENNENIHIGGAGTAMRFLTALLSLQKGNHFLSGTERMKQRPISILVEALRQLGADIRYTEKEGYPPLYIQGTELAGQEIRLEGNTSSQYISALLMIAPLLKEGLTLRLTGNILSRPYIDLTLKMMEVYGVQAEWTDRQTLKVPSGVYRPVSFKVEADWSAASYWYQIAALAPHAEVKLHGLYADSSQGDSQVAELFKPLGVETVYTSSGIYLTGRKPSAEQTEYNLAQQPDLAQTLVVTCVCLGIPFRFSGLQSLRIKETDRIAALIRETRKLGFVLEAENDSVLAWKGKRCAAADSPTIDTYEDHRMALSFAPAAFLFPGLNINNPQVVSKSYPRFWNDLEKAGFILSAQE